MFSKIYALTRKSSVNGTEKDDKIVPFLSPQTLRPIDIARRKNAKIKVMYKEYIKEQYVKERDSSSKVGRLYFAVFLNSSYYDNDCYYQLKKLGNEDGYKITEDNFGSDKYLVFYAPEVSYYRDFLCNKKNQNYFTIGNIEEVD